MQKLTKSEFMSKVINDYYKKRLRAKDVDSHLIENALKIQKTRRKHKWQKKNGKKKLMTLLT